MASRPLVEIYKYSTLQWVALPEPSDYSGLATTIVDSARNQVGKVVGAVVNSDIAKIELKWNYLTVDEYKNIAQLFEPKYNGHFYVPVSFFDVIAGNFEGNITIPPNLTNNKIRLFYPGDRKVQFAKMKVDANGKPIGYQNVALNLIDTGFLAGEVDV